MKTFMLLVPSNTFVADLAVPSDNALLNDPYQVTGNMIRFLERECQRPYTTKTGPEYCQHLCLNTCPEMHPDRLGGLQLMKQQNETLLDLVNIAHEEVLADAQSLRSSLVVTGPVSFKIPSKTMPSAVEQVRKNILNLPATYAYPMNVTVRLVFLPFCLSCMLQCTTGITTINCEFVMSITEGQRSAFSSSVRPPYKFTTGLLAGLFDSIVQQWFLLEQTKELATEASTLSQISFFAVSLNVPSRFIGELRSPFPEASFASSVASALGITSSDIFDPTVCLVD
jgi:hypothetical protein